MNEAETRAELITPKLKASGWGMIEGSKILYKPEWRGKFSSIPFDDKSGT